MQRAVRFVFSVGEDAVLVVDEVERVVFVSADEAVAVFAPGIDSAGVEENWSEAERKEMKACCGKHLLLNFFQGH